MSIRESRESVSAIMDALSVASNLAGNAQVELLRDRNLMAPEEVGSAVDFMSSIEKMEMLQRRIGTTIEGTRELYRFLAILDSQRRGEDFGGLAGLV